MPPRTYELENIDEREDLEIPNELDETIDMPPERIVKVDKIYFYNHTGVKVLFCLSEFTQLLKYKKNKNNPVEVDDALNYNKNPNIKCLDHGNEPLVLCIDEFWTILQELKGIDFDIFKTSVKITFKVEGFKRIRNVVLQRNGVFGYYLIN